MKNKGIGSHAYVAAYEELKSYAEVARKFGVHKETVRASVKQAMIKKSLENAGYVIADKPERTREEAWEDHVSAFERKASKILASNSGILYRPRGPYAIAHFTDEHVDDDGVPLKILEKDIRDAKNLNAIMVQGGDPVNNWPLMGKLAAQWAEQSCTKADALLRLEYMIDLMQPDVWTDGNHDKFNSYLTDLIDRRLPAKTLRGNWSTRFLVESEGGRTLRAVVSHKFQKGSSWFHKAHGHIREMLEGEEADLLMDGHIHSDGVLDHTLPERQHSALCVASAGYKFFDLWADRISHGGVIPKNRGRYHIIIVDPLAEPDENFCTAFKSANQAEAMLNGLQNLRAI